MIKIPHPSRENFVQKLKPAFQSFASLSLIWLFFMLFFSVIEVLTYLMSHSIPLSSIELLYNSWLIDTVFWVKWLFPFAVLYVPLYSISSKFAKIFFSVLLVIFFVIQFILVSYFNASLVMLGSELFSYSFEDLKLTVGASGEIGVVSTLTLLLLISLVVVVLLKLRKNIEPHFYLAITLPLLSFIYTFFSISSSIDQPNLTSDFANNIVTNKSEHFYNAAHTYYFNTGYEVDIYADNYISLGTIGTGDPNFNYIDNALPFLHTASDDDVLSPFFTPNEKAPNIVMVIVEGLGSAFSNKNAYLGSFTPFLDSLSTKSMYWKNFLSNGGRTFAVLPSLAGSLPFGEHGFLGLDKKMPKHISLFSLLKYNNYETSFYYGGDATFDNMSTFLNLNTIDAVYDENDFPENYKKLPESNEFSWGYGDFELYDNYLRITDGEQNEKSRLSVILTVASHSPFLINQQNKYNALFEQRMNDLGLTEKSKKIHRNYVNQYASIVYADDALRSFFNKYKKREDYKNTIFVITGDHRIPEIPMSTKIDRYHVPFIIFSPLLKRSAEIASVSSHFDIAPSLVNYLKTNHNLKTPSVASWLGNGLDTTRTFQNIHRIPLMQTKTQLIDFVMNSYHLNDGTLFKLNDNMEEEPVVKPIIKDELTRGFRDFQIRNSEFSKAVKLIPDTLYTKYTRRY